MIIIKKLFPVLLILISGCSEKLDVEKASEPVEALLEQFATGNLENTSNLCTAFFQAENEESVFFEVYTSIENNSGKIKSYKLSEHTVNHNLELNTKDNVELVYEVSHSSSKTIHTFWVELENGDYKINGYHVLLE